MGLTLYRKVLTHRREDDCGVVMFEGEAWDLLPAERVGLVTAINNLDEGSAVWKFAAGRWDGYAFAGAVGTEVVVTKGWHQEPHFTVRLQFRMAGGWYRRRGGAHVYKDGSESILADDTLSYREAEMVGEWVWPVSFSSLVKKGQRFANRPSSTPTIRGTGQTACLGHRVVRGPLAR
jgi:hypothetical protein